MSESVTWLTCTSVNDINKFPVLHRVMGGKVLSLGVQPLKDEDALCSFADLRA